MATLIRPTFLKKLVAFLIVTSFATYYSNGEETHSLISWALGNSFGAMIIKLLLLFIAFFLACVNVYTAKEE